MRRYSVLASLLVIVALALNQAWAINFTAGPLVQVSGMSLFVACTADNIAGQSGQVYLHSEVEPWIDVNPTNANNLVGIFQQDRWSNGGARGLVAAVSSNGGTTWTNVVIPGISLCSGGIYDRSTDPWVSFSPNGVVHQLALSFNDVAPPFVPRDFDHALLYSRSANGGLTWSTPIEVIRDFDPAVFNDKQSITADPHDPNFVYAVWDRLVVPSTSKRTSVMATRKESEAFRGPTWFSRTTSGGNTWERARLIFDPGANKQTIGNQIAVLPKGDLVNIFDLIESTGSGDAFYVALIRSTDRGRTWGPRPRGGSIKPIIIDRLRTIFVTDPESGLDVRTGDIIPDIAVAPNGDLYAVWQDARPNGLRADAIVISKSTDGGLKWSRFAKVNKTPTNISIKNQQAFTPSVHVAADGTVAVTYYDFRNNDKADPLWTDYFVVHCHPVGTVTCTNSAHWGNEIKLTTLSFDMRQAPFAVGFFTGDYEGLSASNLDFTAFFSQPHGADPSSAFFRRVGVAP